MSSRSNSMRNRNTACVLFVIFILFFIALLVLITPKLASRQVEKIFGPPSPQLSGTRLLYLTALLLLQYDDLTQPVNPGGAEISLRINQGESVASITGRLWETGLITNPGVFSNYLQYAGLDTGIQAGEYMLSPAMSPVEIAHQMQSSISPNVALTILPGWRIEEIANSLNTSGLEITQEEFLREVHVRPEGYSFSTCMQGVTLEGYLFPGSYVVPRETTIEAILPQVLMNFETQVSSEIKDGFTAQGLDLCQAVTLASVVQREAVLEDEMPLIASVFYNRLNQGGLLESDPTVQYALGFNQVQSTWWTNPLSYKDLQVDSPYNTYLYAGLPPGPISNPGLAALQAVAFPAQTPYYYFRSACDGSGRHLFAETFSEHVANECP